MSDTPETDKCVKANKHLKFLQEDVWVNANKITYENPIVFLCQKLERERDEYRGLLIELYNDLNIIHSGNAVRKLNKMFREENYN